MNESNQLPLQLQSRVTLCSREEAARAVAAEIATLVRARPDAVLGLATGRSPIAVYAELLRLHHEEGLDFGRVVTFNLDEYRGLAPDDPRSFRAFMRARLFEPAGFDPARTHVPDGAVPDAELESACAAYERAIAGAGGLDLQILGIGRNGHVGFDEPGSPADSRTRSVALAPETRADAAGAFGSLDAVPRAAITMGIATILSARRIRVLAFGATKADAVCAALTGPVGPDVPASFLRRHRDVRFFVDEAAAARLRAVRSR